MTYGHYEHGSSESPPYVLLYETECVGIVMITYTGAHKAVSVPFLRCLSPPPSRYSSMRSSYRFSVESFSCHIQCVQSILLACQLGPRQSCYLCQCISSAFRPGYVNQKKLPDRPLPSSLLRATSFQDVRRLLVGAKVLGLCHWMRLVVRTVGIGSVVWYVVDASLVPPAFSAHDDL